MWRVYIQNHPLTGRCWRLVKRQPGWIVKIALAASALVVLVPLLALVLLLTAAAVVGGVVFLVLAILMSILSLPHRLFKALFLRKPQAGADDGRENVVVLRSDSRLF